jgi:16S rRNA (uracil1498-N3)-methyltransferase
VLRLDGERALKKVMHWQAVAASACEQSGRTHVPVIYPVQAFKPWLDALEATPGQNGVLSFAPKLSIKLWLAQRLAGQDGGVSPAPIFFLSGPEGGLSPEEEALARGAGWSAIGLGPRVLRADTAPLMALSTVAALWEGTASGG